MPSGYGEVQTVKEKGYKNIIEHCVRLGKPELKARLEAKCRSMLIKTKEYADSSDDKLHQNPRDAKQIQMMKQVGVIIIIQPEHNIHGTKETAIFSKIKQLQKCYVHSVINIVNTNK